MSLRHCTHGASAASDFACQVASRHDGGGAHGAVPGGVEHQREVLIGVTGEPRIAEVVLQGFPPLYSGVRDLDKTFETGKRRANT
jgi:hypothetical protein